jgi:hypothetical protein
MPMSSYGKINMLGMLALPLIAVLGSIIIFGVRVDTQLFVLGTNAVPMLIGGLVSALLLRSVNKRGGGGHYVALLPTLVPAGFGTLWYLFGAVTAAGDTGREYFAGPFYLLAWAIGTAIVAWVSCLLMRAKKSPA